MRDDAAIQALRETYGVPAEFELASEGEVLLAWRDESRAATAAVGRDFDALPAAEATGRAALRRVTDGDGADVLVRPYRKGGMARGVRGSRFRGRLRPLDELVLHAELEAAGVPVLHAVGCVVVGDESGWDGFLLTHEQESAVDLDAWLEGAADLEGHAEAATTLARAGAAVAALHAHGIEHADLHPKNVLLTTEGAALVIDLDRAVRRPAPLDRDARVRNLARFERSLVKQRAKQRTMVRWDPVAFYGGYADGDEAAAARWHARALRKRGGLGLRRFWWRFSGQTKSGGGA